MDDTINYVNSICQNKGLIDDINKYINLNSLMFKYLNEVYYFYNERNKNNNLNYQIVYNLKKIFEQFSIPKIFECYENNVNYLKLFKKYINNVNNFILKIEELSDDDFNDEENKLNITGITNPLEEENNEEVIEKAENSNFHFNISKSYNTYRNNNFKFNF